MKVYVSTPRYAVTEVTSDDHTLHEDRGEGGGKITDGMLAACRFKVSKEG